MGKKINRVRVLYLCHRCPYPPNKGDRIRTFNILNHLSKKYSVNLVYPSFSKQDLQQVENLQPYCENVETVRLWSWTGALRCGIHFLLRQPLTTAFFYSRRLSHIIMAQTYDVVLVDCSSMSQYVENSIKPKIIDFVDVDSDKWRLYSESASFPKSVFFSLEHKRLRVLERKLVKQFNVSLVISENEKRFLPDSDRVVVVPNGVALEFFAPQKRTSERDIIIFTGAMDYFPNVDGVLYFHQEILPLIKTHVPTVKFIIAGMNPTSAIKKLNGKETIVTGYVEDIREYLSMAAVCVVPLRIGKGIQNKVLEAMAMKIPVVATTSANEGINARHKKEIFLADTSDSFAEAVVLALSDAKLREDIANRARQFVEERFCWGKTLERLDSLVDTIANE